MYDSANADADGDKLSDNVYGSNENYYLKLDKYDGAIIVEDHTTREWMLKKRNSDRNEKHEVQTKRR